MSALQGGPQESLLHGLNNQSSDFVRDCFSNTSLLLKSVSAFEFLSRLTLDSFYVVLDDIYFTEMAHW